MTEDDISSDPLTPFVDPFRPWVRYIHSGTLIRMRRTLFRWRVEAILGGCKCPSDRVKDCWDRCIGLPGGWP